MKKIELDEKIETLLKNGNVQSDGMSMFVMADGQFRGAFFNGTRMINKMRKSHNLGILETYILGQAYLCAALLIPTMKGKEHLTFRYDTNGPAAGFSVEADSTGYVRGFLLQDPVPVNEPLQSWDLSPFFGDGTITMQRLGEGMREPMISSVPIQYKNIAKDLAFYFAQSEQIHTSFSTGIQFDKEGNVIGAGGLFLQSIPGAGGKSKISAQSADSGLENKEEIEDELITRVENALRALPNPGKWFSEGGDREDIIYGLFREFNPAKVLDRDVIFDCPCSEDGFRKRILALSKEEVESLKAEGKPLEVICHNCGSKYSIEL